MEQKEITIDILSIKEFESFSSRDKRFGDVKSFLDSNRLAKYTKAKSGSKNRFFAAGAGLLLSFAALSHVEKQQNDAKEVNVAKQIKETTENTKRKVSNNRKSTDAGQATEDVKVTVRTWSYDKLMENLCNLAASTSFDIQSLDYEIGDKGKPFWADKSLPFFSLSHSGDYVVLVTAPNEVGVDLQQHREVSKTSVSNHHFAAEEAEYLVSEDSEPTDFFILWTRKEAFGKCLGHGLVPELGRSFLDLDGENFKNYYWMEIDGLTGYSMALCMRL